MSFAGVALVPFAWDGSPARAMRATFRRAAGHMTIEWCLDGATALRWPPRAAAPARADRLWEHTCFEAFLAPVGSAAYWEVNLSPSGDWQLYRFTGYRGGMAIEDGIAPAPAVVASYDGGAATVAVTLDVRAVPALAAGAVDVGLTAVLEAGDGERTYWALRHTAPQPDFHRRDAFVLRWPAEEGA